MNTRSTLLIVISAATTVLMLSLSGLLQARDVLDKDKQQGLSKVKHTKFRETYVDTNIDFSAYNKLHVGKAYFDYRDDPPKHPHSSYYARQNKASFGITLKDRQKFESIVSDAFVSELGKSKQFTLSEDLDGKTIIMRGAAVDIVSKVPPETIGRSDIYLATVAQVTLVMEFVDGADGTVLARIAERGRIGEPGGQLDAFSQPANSVTIMADVKRWAHSTARRLRAELELAIEDTAK